MAPRRHKADWSELYPELISSIAGRLEAPDFRNFRSVCTKWRSSTHQIPNNLPILSPIFPHNFPHSTHNNGYRLTIVANTTFLLQNPNPNCHKPWLVTVEELNHGKLILRMPLVRNAVKEDFPRVIDLTRVRVRKIRKDYNFRNVGDGSLPPYCKLLLFSDDGCGDPTSVDDCYALVLDHKNKLLFTRLNDKHYHGYLKCGGIARYNDIVCYKGAIWTIDLQGRVYVLRRYGKQFSLNRLTRFADAPNMYIGWGRTRLIESDEGLYLIYRNNPYNKLLVYKLNEVEHKWCEVKDLDGRILFVSSDCCFFASVEDFPGYVGNCILFPKDYFYPSNPQTDKVLEIKVFNLDDGKSGLITTYPGFSDIFWPPPCWLFTDTCPSTSLLEGDEENEGKIPTLGAPCASNGVQICKQALETKLPAMDVHPIHRDTHASRFQNFNCGAPWKTFKRKRHNIEPNLRDEEENEAEISILDVPCAPNGVQIGEQASKTKLPAMDAHPICRDSHAPTVQNFSHDAPRKTLKRYNIESNLIPTLEKILEKHGDITEGCAMRNNDMISTALESLATTVLILKKNTGRSLSESQADYLGSSLSDLQHMRFKVGWLAPFVEMALAIKKSRPLVDSLKEVSEAEAPVHESKMKIIPVLEEVDLDKGLGEGLY